MYSACQGVYNFCHILPMTQLILRKIQRKRLGFYFKIGVV